jgi:asparagine synthase (glutamine-hydrolysing)
MQLEPLYEHVLSNHRSRLHVRMHSAALDCEALFMCGICGSFGYANQEPISSETLAGMLGVIRHRGPDDEGVYVDGELALGMRRLSIIDVAGGRQPITNEDGSVIVVFNGEIYNYVELRQELRARGHIFSTASDTEVIAHLWEEFGEACPSQLRGMFTFAIWDVPRRRLFLARDRLGIKPLYYTDVGGRLLFASEIKAILQDPAVTARADFEALSNFLSLKYVPAPQTMFAGIQALPPAHTLSCDSRGLIVRSYWDLSFSNHRKWHNENECAEQLEALLRESVRLHLVSDVPFGAFLSGGLDSSTIVGLMTEMLERPVKTFSVGYQGEAAATSELPWARRIARKFRTDHHEVFVTAQDFADLAEKAVWHLDQPIADDATIPTYMLSQLASRDVKMVLTGEGSDELFAGYARHAGLKLTPLFNFVPQLAKSGALAAMSRLPGFRRPKLALYALCQPDEIARMVNWFPLFNEEAKALLLSSQMKRAVNGTPVSRVFADQLSRSDAVDRLSRMLYVDTKLWLPDDLLARGDKMSMAASLEARVPFLDHKLVEFAASLPSRWKLNGFARKYLLKKVVRQWLPTEIVDRKKKGFPVPVSLWFRKEARSYVRDVLSPAAVRQRGIFDPLHVQRLLDHHDTGILDSGSQIWGLLNIELWFRQFIDKSRAWNAGAAAQPIRVGASGQQ